MNALVSVPREPRVRAAPRRFDALTIALHWASVILIAGLFASAWSLAFASGGEQARSLLTLHRSLGVTVWLLAIGRFAWRVTLARTPPLPASMPPLQVRAAALSEYGLYALMLLQPLTRLAQSVTRGRPFQLFMFQAPALMVRDKPLTALFHQVHELTAWALVGLIALHVSAALFHGLVKQDGVLGSMLPWRPAKKISAAGNKPAPTAV
jgi:cytochrome b561